MTTCVTGFCGTSPGTGPLPGDPSNNSILMATPAYGGIDVTWTLPSQNAYAMVHVQVFRNTLVDFPTARMLGITGGNFYFDPVEEGTTYFYWIVIVSNKGTEGEPIGPVSSSAMSSIQKTIEDLTGVIDEGFLANALQTKIDKITLNYAELLAEISNRIAGNSALADMLAELELGLLDAVALVNTEITIRTDGQNALANQVTILAAANSSNAAAIISEQTARVSADSAMASNITNLFTATGNNAAALIAEQNTRTSQDAALSSAITTAQASLGGEIASVRTDMTADITTVNGKATAIGARWTAVVDVSGLVGGFGVYNNGNFVEAGFNVDKFWIGRTIDKVKPFIMSAGTVFIDKAVIRNADIGTLKIEGNAVTVPQYVQLPGTGDILIGADVTNFGPFTSTEGTWIGDITSGPPIDSINNLILLTGRCGYIGPGIANASKRIGIFKGTSLIHDSGWSTFIGDYFTVSFIDLMITVGTTYTVRIKGRGYDPATVSTATTAGITIFGAKR